MNKKINIILMILGILLLLSGCEFQAGSFIEGVGDPGYNTFLNPIVPPATTPQAASTANTQPNPQNNEDSFSFLLITDYHLIRPDSGVYFATDAFKAWLETEKDNLDFVLNLGDVTDDARVDQYQDYHDFVEILKDDYGLACYSVMGNHDNRNPDLSIWKTYTGLERYYRLEHKGISFYMLDTSYRTLGKTQMRYLSEAIQQDSNPKLFCTHIPLYGKADLFYFALADTQERNLLLKLMTENNVGMYLSGHHHKGDVIYQYTDTCTEFVAGAFHGRDSIFEGPARWYVCTYDKANATFTIDRYTKYNDTADVSDIEKTPRLGTFKLPH